ncbi:hypothetical protein [Microbispora sp. GKU 823]|uniref:hypothetical protein n=1 Tax=Microbispora sp. GKU 823 TaxID=1652100 RepID=UPI0009A39E7B|nr:hypothetical protein [Microbispora sp. GKU 823]OPG13875.1 hypothetical protein B1L11_05010 [Microbispora sp. GKU 823]
MSARTFGIIALVLLAVGLVVGFMPVSYQGVNCGSAFAASGDALVSDLTEGTRVASSCDDARGLLRLPAYALVGVGLVGFVAASFVKGRRQNGPSAA